MTITRDNYEPFFLDFLEGNLKETMIDDFLDFLELNPDLKAELHLFEQFHLPEQQVVFSGKKHLYKSAAKEKTALEVKTIALMEGDLKEEEQLSFKAYIAAHPELQKEYDLMTKTRLVADSRIKYPHKNNLHKRSGAILWLNWAASIAAFAVILWGISSLFQPGSQPNSLDTTQEMGNQVISRSGSLQKGNQVISRSGSLHNGNQVISRSLGLKKGNQVNSRSGSLQERDLTVPEEIIPVSASLKTEPLETLLAVSHSANIEKIKGSRHFLSLDKFLTSRAKRLGGQGLLSANKIIRTGLNMASELSGDRIGYKVKNGKIASLDFESKLMAFSIPLQKE